MSAAGTGFLEGGHRAGVASFGMVSMPAGARTIRYVVATTVALYLVALASPCVLWDGYPDDRRIFGIEILAKGWAGPLAWDLSWYANPLLFFILVRSWQQRRVPMKWLCCALLLLAAAVPLFPVVHTNAGIVTLSRFLTQALDIFFGVYLWAACMALGGMLCLLSPGARQPSTRDAPGG